jgi:glycosyltransferase involved in cell wall biosynthesis
MTTVMNRLAFMLQRICGYKPKKVAHFLLIPELLYSPPNNAIIQAYLSLGYAVDIFSPGDIEIQTAYGDQVKMLTVGYSWPWIIKNMFSFKWLSYEWISGTSEDPLAVVGILSFVYRKKSFTLVDEIKAGGYRGDRSGQWKMLCKWGIKRAHFKIVNDKHRIELLIDYANLNKKDKIIVYPGCYVQRPETVRDSQSIKKSWGLPSNAFVIGSSGGFNLTAGADWLLESIREIKDIYAVVQPLGVSPLSIFLMENVEYSDRLFIEKNRLSWYEAWKNCIGFDIGLSIYTNPAPQFQKMGISSNRLCMFIAMGVPVIASRQESFNFLEEYDCGIIVESYNDFKLAIQEIRTRKSILQENCKRCFTDYIRPSERFNTLLNHINEARTGERL